MKKKKSNNTPARPTGPGAKARSKEAGMNDAARHSPMDVELLERLVKLMASHDLSKVDLRDGNQRVVLKRGTHAAAHHGSMHGLAPAFAPMQAHLPGSASGAPAASSGASVPASTPPGTGESDKDLLAIKSPMVGTFYSSPSPDAPPFVTVGSEVDEESDVCIIEAMKVFNNIKAECRGTIAKVQVSEGQTVEFGQVLFLVKPS